MALLDDEQPDEPRGFTGSDVVEEGRLLDGFLLLAAGGSSNPDDVVSVNLSSLQIIDLAEEDLAFFENLDRLDVSDNQLSYEHVLQQLSRLPRLNSLVLACNSISSLQVHNNSHEFFRNLESLDLSYNELHGDVLSQLALLPSLQKLNLSSNCISSVPPENELEGLQVLEELILDANDLVQFIQWRALDALPRLKKLSLASNRVKRLKDDAPDTAQGDELAYFYELEELDLASNEIASIDSLPVIKLFRSLQKLRLNDNPCVKGDPGSLRLHGVKVISDQSKPFYLKGGAGVSRQREKNKQPRVKLNRRKMRKIKASEHERPSSHQKSAAQLGILDEEANQLLISLQNGVPIPPLEQRPMPPEDENTSSVLITQLPEAPAESTLLSDNLSDDELDQIFRERRARIDREFRVPAQEPSTFMRTPPFAVSAAAGQKLGLAAPASGALAVATTDVALATRTGEKEGGATTPTNAKRGSSSAFLTSVGDEPIHSDASRTTTTRAQRHQQAQSQPGSPLSAGPGLFDAPSARSPTGSGAVVPLPPIQPGSRGSSAGGPRPDEFAPKRLPAADIGVRDAILALRAAAKSEYGVRDEK